jgi:hypothetical protein
MMSKSLVLLGFLLFGQVLAGIYEDLTGIIALLIASFS